MGGDHAPEMVVAGADMARLRCPEIDYLFFGDEQRIKPLLANLPDLERISTIHHTPDAISNDAKPAAALRGGRNSSMRLPIEALGQGKAACVGSPANTPPTMPLAKFFLKTLPGI